MNKEKIENAFNDIIDGLLEDTDKIDRDDLKDTPKRVATSYGEIFEGVGKDEREPLLNHFDTLKNDMVILKDIDFYSMCEHHFLPFFGKVDIAYIPNGKIVGFGDIIKCVEIVAKRPQLQERMNTQIADAIYETLDCQGVIVKIEAQHLCMTMRGVKKENSKIVTLACRGIYEQDTDRRLEVMSLFK